MDPDASIGVGDRVPDVTLMDDSGVPVNLLERSLDQTLILFFYSQDEGLFCRTQACSLRDSWPLLRSEGIGVYGVNHQSAESHARYRETYGLPFPLLVDEDLKLARAFGFTYPWAALGIAPVKRSTAIIDPGGVVRAILPKVKPTAHFDLLRMHLGPHQRNELEHEAG